MYMVYRTNIELLKEEMSKAEAALASYLQSNVYDPGHHEQLAGAVRFARNEYLHELEVLPANIPGVEPPTHYDLISNPETAKRPN